MDDILNMLLNAWEVIKSPIVFKFLLLPTAVVIVVALIIRKAIR